MTGESVASSSERPSRARPALILLAEDSPSDAALTAAALVEGGIECELAVVSDGEAAMGFLRRTGSYTTAARPDLILLDLNLPKKDGREVLCEVKGDPALSSIPLIIFTTSAAGGDILRAYEHGANSYVTKAVDFDDLATCVRRIADFWLSLVRLPAGGQ